MHRWFNRDSLSRSTTHGGRWFTHLCSLMMWTCGSLGVYSAIAVDGEALPQFPLYSRIPASLSFASVMKNISLLPVHFHRSSALNRLTMFDMVSDEEKRMLMTQGHLKHPVLQLHGNAPILNFIVWRRSSMIVLLTIAVVLDVFRIYKTIVGEPRTEKDALKARVELEPFHEWQAGHDAHFPDYIKHATQLMFSKCYYETAYIMIVKMHIQTILRLLVLIPLICANWKWVSWTKSSNWLRAVWAIIFSMPFVTLSVPSRFLINFDNLIKDDVFLLKRQVTIHYNLNHTLRDTLDQAAHLCGREPAHKIESMLETATFRGSQAESTIKNMCGIASMLDQSEIIAQFTDWHEHAHRTAMRCKIAEESIEWAKTVSNRNRPQAQKRLGQAKLALNGVCSSIEQMDIYMRTDEDGMSEKTRQIHNLATLLVKDGLAGLSESLNTLVGAVNGVASFKSLWTSALSLGPGIIKGAMRAKSIIPEASLPGAFLLMMPWIYAPLAWSLFNVIVQIFGNWALLFATASFAFYPIVMSIVGGCFFVGSPQRPADLTDLMWIFKRIEVFAVSCTAALAGLWVYQAYTRINEAADEHPILKRSMEFVTAQSRQAFDHGKHWAQEHIMHFDALDWLSKHPVFAVTCLFNFLEPVGHFFQAFILTSMMATDWILLRVSNERRFEFLAANRDQLPYDASMAEIEQLAQSRTDRIDALVVAFGGAVEKYQENHVSIHKERCQHARK